MSGHSKWAGIKHKKALIDAKRGKLFSKLIKEITVSARQGGGNLDTNIRLRTAAGAARDANMPAENIKRAIKKGTGELSGTSYEDVTYEGYGPGGVAIMLECLTDNKNRTSAEIRNIFSKKGGNLAGTGSVSWLFQRKGLIIIDKKEVEENKLMSIILEAGAEDLRVEGDVYEVITGHADLDKIKKSITEKGLKYTAAELTMDPKNTVKVDGAAAKQVLGLVESLEDSDDVQHVYANFDIPDEIIEETEEKNSK
ncbi:MAG: YebC/PmpR family DNA-binding transcriptional regulator [Candidatus Omnitrophota bacterium]|nr:YebC/PmpR family DNA-binding transcriptional regulator [Candidatus Omnitrophota bacterium]